MRQLIPDFNEIGQCVVELLIGIYRNDDYRFVYMYTKFRFIIIILFVHKTIS